MEVEDTTTEVDMAVVVEEDMMDGIKRTSPFTSKLCLTNIFDLFHFFERCLEKYVGLFR